MPDSPGERLKLVERGCSKLSIVRQCELLGINRSNVYYRPVPVSDYDLLLMKKIDEIYTEMPFYGSPKITKHLQLVDKLAVNHKKVERLMAKMGLYALVPRKNTSKKHPNHSIFPYLLKNKKILHPNHVWGVDITFVRGYGSWFYLVAILDWYSRYVLSWRLSKALTADFCVEALNDALKMATPQIHNSDQGSQFTSFEYVNKLKERSNIKISMDGRGRCFDNIFTERLWRTVKYEEVYLKEYQNFNEAQESLNQYFHLYNDRRLHASLNYQTPQKVYFSKVESVSHN